MRRSIHVIAAGALGIVLAGCASTAAAGRPSGSPLRDSAPPGGLLVAPVASEGGYQLWVASESVDEVALIEFDGESATVVERKSVGHMPVEIDGPHGVALAPDGSYVYVTLGHGLPTGWLLKIDPERAEVIGRANLGMFPATVAITPDGQFGFVSNFNLHGDHVPSSISKVHLGMMVEVGRAETCVMPHGSRINPEGTRHYSVCMMDQRLVEIDVATGDVLRTFSVVPGMEGPLDHGTHGTTVPPGEAPGCSPTWAEPSADGSRVFVTCNRAGEVLEIDVERWEIVRRFDTGDYPYNLGVTPDGRLLLVTLRHPSNAAVEVYDLASGEQAGRIPTSTTHAHGIAVSEDSRYAFVSVEGVGAEPGKVDVIDLRGMRRAASVEVGQQATGIALVPASR